MVRVDAQGHEQRGAMPTRLNELPAQSNELSARLGEVLKQLNEILSWSIRGSFNRVPIGPR